MFFLFLIFSTLFVGLFSIFTIKSANLSCILFNSVLFFSMPVVVFKFLYTPLGLEYSKYSLNKLLSTIFSLLAISWNLCFLNFVLSAISSPNFGFNSGCDFVFSAIRSSYFCLATSDWSKSLFMIPFLTSFSKKVSLKLNSICTCK